MLLIVALTGNSLQLDASFKHLTLMRVAACAFSTWSSEIQNTLWAI